MRYRAQRRATDLPVTVIVPQGEYLATLRNISTSGARIDGLPNFPTGKTFTVLLQGISRQGRVVWCRGGAQGIKFLRPLELSEMRRILSYGHATHRKPNALPQRRAQHGFAELR